MADAPALGGAKRKVELDATAFGATDIEAYEFDLSQGARPTRRVVCKAQKLDYGEREAVRLLLTISDVTGSLARFTRLLAEAKASVVQIHHDRAFGATELNETVVEVVLETRGFPHIEEVRAALLAGGYRVQ